MPLGIVRVSSTRAYFWGCVVAYHLVSALIALIFFFVHIYYLHLLWLKHRFPQCFQYMFVELCNCISQYRVDLTIWTKGCFFLSSCLPHGPSMHPSNPLLLSLERCVGSRSSQSSYFFQWFLVVVAVIVKGNDVECHYKDRVVERDSLERVPSSLSHI